MAQEEKDKSSSGIWPYAVAALVGAAGASVAAWNTMRDRFNRDLRITKSLNHINKPYIEDLETYYAEYFTEGSIDAATWCKKTGDRKVEHAEKLAAELKARDFPTGLIEGIKLRYMQLSPGSKKSMAINAGITAAVGFCGAFTLFNNIHTHRQIETLIADKSNAPAER